MTSSPPSETPLAPGKLLGVVLAGGESRRFGGDKALTVLAGKAMGAWTLEALVPWTAEQVVIANDPAVSRTLGVPGRPDMIPGQGPLGGLLTGLSWAEEKGMGGVFLLACDLPLVSPDLVGRILGAWPPGVAAIVPGSSGPRGLEPLCGVYAVGGVPALRTLLTSGNRFMVDALAELGAHRIPPEDLGPQEEVDLAFINVNTVEDAQVAEEALLERIRSRIGGGADRSLRAHRRDRDEPGEEGS